MTTCICFLHESKNIKYSYSVTFKCSPYGQIDLDYLKEVLYFLYPYSFIQPPTTCLVKCWTTGMQISTLRVLSS